MTAVETEITALRLATALAEIFEQVANDGAPVHQDSRLPASARRALAMLSGQCLRAGPGLEDLGASVHVMMDKACEPFRTWGLPMFAPPFRFADVRLVDRDLGVPTEDCREMARQAGSGEAAALEEIHHEQLRATLKNYPAKERTTAYTRIRELVVRNPLIQEENLQRAIIEGGHASAARTIMSFYRRVPQAALFGETARRCPHCRSLLWPDRDVAAFPGGRCRIRQCRLAHPAPARFETIDDPNLWRLGTNAVLAYWVGPGLDEVAVFDALKSAGRRVTLYPQSDAADVGVDGMKIGIDVKTFASPVVLAAKLSRSIGRLDMFERKIVAVPDDKLRLNPRYLEQLRDSYQGQYLLDFMTVGSVVQELSS